jgi:hypothetical protein
MDAKTLYDRIADLDRETLVDAVQKLLDISFIEDDDETNPDKDLDSDHLGQIANVAHEILDEIETLEGGERWFTGVALWPESVCDDYPRSTFTDHCLAKDEDEAAAKIRLAASKSEMFGEAALEPDEFVVIALWPGKTEEVYGPGSLS